MESFLKQLVSFQTVEPNKSAFVQAFDYLERFFAGHGLHTVRKTYEGHETLVATTHLTKTPTVMLVAHVDVVGAPEKLFTLKEKDGKYFGRGVWDMKFAIAAYMEVLERLAAATKDYDFGIMLVADEETLDLGIQHLLNDGFLPKVAVLPDGGADWQIEKVAKAAWFVRISVTGKPAHGSRPWEGDSASFKLVALLHELIAIFEGHGPDTHTLNIASLHSGSGAMNQLPDSAEATLDLRMLSRDAIEKLEKKLNDLCKQYQGSWEEIVYFPPLEHDHSNPYILRFAESIQKITGVTSSGIVSYGASDASRFDALGIPCVVVRPPGGGHHGTDEWIDKQGFLQLPSILVDYLNTTSKK